MDEEHEQVEESTPSPEPEAAKETRLRRSTKRRMVGGVAGGIAERFDVDANIVRVVFVVLTVLYGLGAAIYLAMWVLIPQSGRHADDAEESGDAPPASNLRLLRYVLLAGVVVVAVIVLSTIGDAPRVGNGFGALWLIFLAVLAVLSLRSSARQHMLRRFVALVFLTFLTIIILVSGAYLGQFGYDTQPFRAIPPSLKTVASQERAPHLNLDVQVGAGQLVIRRGYEFQSP